MAEAKKEFEGYTQVESGKFITWDKVGQTVKGILIDRNEQDDRLKPGQRQWVYTLQLDEALDLKNDLHLREGDEARVGSRGQAFDKAMAKIVNGQHVLLHFAEEIKSKTAGNNPFKLIKVYAGALDPDWKAEGDSDSLIEAEADINDIPFKS